MVSQQDPGKGVFCVYNFRTFIQHGVHILGKPTHSSISVGDPPVWIWLLGEALWLVIAVALASSSGWGAIPTLVISILGALVAATVWGPMRMTLREQTLSVRTLWRRRDFDLNSTLDATATGMSSKSSGELSLRFHDGRFWYITLRDPKNISFAQEVVHELESLGRSEIIRDEARFYLE